MTSDRMVDLIEVDWPICLIVCERELGCMKPGETLEVLVRDPDVMNAIVILIGRLPAFHMEFNPEGAHYRLHIRKEE